MHENEVALIDSLPLVFRHDNLKLAVSRIHDGLADFARFDL